MTTVTWLQFKNLVAYLAGRAEDTTSTGKLTPSEATAMQGYVAGMLPTVWNREAWPGLCDNLEQMTVDSTTRDFSLREGQANPMGNILGIFDVDPSTNTNASRLTNWSQLDDRVVIPDTLASVWVDWQTLCPSPTTVIAYTDASTLPDFLHYPLACYAAAFLMHDEDPLREAQLRASAEAFLAELGAQIQVPWWRQRKAQG